MSREKRTELTTAAFTHLEQAAKLLHDAEEEVLADQVAKLADLVDVVTGPAEEAA